MIALLRTGPFGVSASFLSRADCPQLRYHSHGAARLRPMDSLRLVPDFLSGLFLPFPVAASPACPAKSRLNETIWSCMLLTGLWERGCRVTSSWERTPWLVLSPRRRQWSCRLKFMQARREAIVIGFDKMDPTPWSRTKELPTQLGVLYIMCQGV